MQQFNEFIDRKQREAKRHLQLLEKIFQRAKMKVENYLDEEEPYIFVQSPAQSLSFDGVRIYEIGKTMAYRVQKEARTHPYGKAYSLDLEDMFNDYMSDNIKEEEAGKKVMESVVEEVKKFFKQSARAEAEIDSEDGSGGIQLRTGGTDYSTLVHAKS